MHRPSGHGSSILWSCPRKALEEASFDSAIEMKLFARGHEEQDKDFTLERKHEIAWHCSLRLLVWSMAMKLENVTLLVSFQSCLI